MNEDNTINEENNENINKDNSEIINKLYSNNNSSEKHNSKIEYSGMTKLQTEEESERYIKEMHELADKNELKNNFIVLGLGIVIVSIIIFSVLMNTSFIKPKGIVATKEDVKKSIVNSDSTKPVEIKDNIYEYLNVETNRESDLNNAVALNTGNQTGITVYLLSEILRSNTYDIPEDTSTVNELMTNLTSMGWKKNTNFNELEKGDICFTTDMPEKPGVPSHTYVFMGWVEDGKTDYANIVDGQVEEYGNVLHKRNISISTAEKDKFSFFLRK